MILQTFTYTFVTTTLLVSTVTAYDCDSGCELHGPVICGTDGITYADACLAVCQGVKVLHPGACDGDAVAPEAERKLSGFRPKKISKRRMARFKGEGFKYVGHYEVHTNENLTPRTLSARPDGAKRKALTAAERKAEMKKGLRAVRLTSGGDEYRTKFGIPARLSAREVWAAPFAPGGNFSKEGNRLRRVLLGGEVEERHGRKLRVFGTDDRVQIVNTKVWPYIVFGQLTGDGSCSGTVISYSSVVTAAHCVYNNDPRVRKWTGMTMFHPARNGSDMPFGTWTSDYRTTFLGWINHEGCSLGTCETDAFRWDMAVMTLNKKNGKFIGEVTGWAGFQSLSPNAPAFDESTITGYPGDKPLGTMWRSWNCPDGFWKDPDHHPIIRYLCDIVQGSSGSSIMTQNWRVVGLVAFQQRQFNGGNYLDSARARSLELWSHRGTSGVIRVAQASHKCLEVNTEKLTLSLQFCHYGLSQQFYWLASTSQIKSSWSRHYCLEYRTSDPLHFRKCDSGLSQKWYRTYLSQLKSYKSKKRCMRYDQSKGHIRMSKCRSKSSYRFIFADKFWT